MTSKSKITRAVIACGGWSTRFLPVAKVYNKALIPLFDRPVIDYLLAEMAGAGIEEVALVHRPDDHSLAQYYQEYPRLNRYLRQNNKLALLAGWSQLKKAFRRLEFIAQPETLPYGSASPLLAAQKFLGDEPFIYKYGDDLTLEKIAGSHLRRLLAAFTDTQAVAAISAQKVTRERISRLGSLHLKADKTLLEIEEKPVVRADLSLLANVSPFVFTSAIWPVLHHVRQNLPHQEFRLTDAVNLLAKQGQVRVEVLTEAQWCTTGDPQNWLVALNQLARLRPA